MPSIRHWAERAALPEHPGKRDATAVRRFARFMGPVLRLAHRPSLTGAENLPRDRPFLLVANHSGGFGGSELCCLLLLAQEQFPELRIAGFAHPFAFHLWPFTVVMRLLGSVPATHAGASAAFASGCSVLVFPGGDHEVSRPFWKADVVDWNGRKGFLRVARTAGVPIVPLGIRGSHWTAPTLGRSTRVLPWLLVLPRVFGMKRYPIMLLAVLGAIGLVVLVQPWWLGLLLAWLWMVCPLSVSPWIPATIRMRIGEPIEVGVLFGETGTGDPASDTELAQAYERVLGAVQALVRR